MRVNTTNAEENRDSVACAYLKAYGKTSNIHGIHYLTENRSKTEKVVWAVILLTALSGCVFMIRQIWDKYKNNPIVINFTTSSVSVHEIPFPAVTLCPPSNCAAKKFNYTDAYNKVFNNESISEENLQKFRYTNFVCNDDYDFLVSDETMDEGFFSVIEEVRPDIDFLCFFLGEPYKCEDLLASVITDEGLCYSFNILKGSEIFRQNVLFHGNFTPVYNTSDLNDDFTYSPDAGLETYPRRVFLSGLDNSLQFLFFKIDSNSDPTCTWAEDGYKVIIHNPWETPHSKHYLRIAYDEAISVALRPQLILTSNEAKYFHPDKRNCYLSNERPLKYFRKYSHSNCFLECWTNITQEKCGCVDFFMPRDIGTPLCGSKNLDCVTESMDTLRLEQMKSKVSKNSQTRCDCKQSCNSLTYDSETFSYNFFLDKYISAHKAEMGKAFSTDLKSALLQIYFKSDEFMAMERKELYGISDFISNFGGLLGLFTGFSIISLVEMIYFFSLRIVCNSRLYGYWSGPVN